MITKEQARTLYNLHVQIETTEKLIRELEEQVSRDEAENPSVITPTYVTNGSIEIHVPYFSPDGFVESKGARVFNIRYGAAVQVLTDHVQHLKQQLNELNDGLFQPTA